MMTIDLLDLQEYVTLQNMYCFDLEEINIAGDSYMKLSWMVEGDVYLK